MRLLGRHLKMAALIASAAWVSGCGARHEDGARAGVAKCPPLPASVPPFGAGSLLVTDIIDNRAPPGSPLRLMLESRSDDAQSPGVCVDGADGDIHLYGAKTRRAAFRLSFNPALSFNAIWPANPQTAIVVSDRPNGPWIASNLNARFATARILEFTVEYEHDRAPYYYRLQYVDPNDPDDVPHSIQAMIINH